jgi:phosphatidylserine/phosphatidylglycerophosphate/cardiolipin synthase-like enzyme
MFGNDPAGSQLITSNKAYAEFVMAKVRQALSEILIDTYALEFDGFGQPLLSELEYACQRGLQVRCLIDASGSQNFIQDHPELLRKLETEIRIRDFRNIPGNFIVFDRKLAVVGSHGLCESNIKEQSEVMSISKTIVGEGAAEIADRINADWQQTRPCR